MARVGNRQNSALNGLWVSHARPFGKKIGSKKRRAQSKKIILEKILCCVIPYRG